MTTDDEFNSLDPDRITETIGRLAARIEDRFPGAGLSRVCRRLLTISQQAGQRAIALDQPNHRLRAVAILAVALILGCALAEFWFIRWENVLRGQIELIEAGINLVVLVGAAVFFLLTLERRFKRNQALAAIHELRALAHIIDMHQLTKDPERILENASLTGMKPAPGDTRLLSRFELGRYLDYCSEMLSLIGKLGALYVQHFDDSVAMTSVNEVETLCTGLTRKIWQKIMILHADQNDDSAEGRQP